MTTLTETRHAGGFIKSEANGHRSRETVTLLEGEVVVPGEVLGKLLADRGTVTVGDVSATGTGDGTLTKATPAYGSGVQGGYYIARCVEKTADSGLFEVIRPDGTVDGFAVVGTAYDGQVKFTIADGAADFAQDKVFTIPVSIADPTGAGKYVAYDQDGSDGSEIPAGIAFGEYDATDGDLAIVAIVREAEVVGDDLTWPDDIEAGEKEAALATLAESSIIVR